MIEFAKLTGKSDVPYYEVQIRTGERIHARFVNAGFGISLPSAKWCTDNKDRFLAVLSYEGDNVDEPIILGFSPLENAQTSDSNVYERLLKVVIDLVERLLNAKVNTQIGPQPFLVDTIQDLNNMKTELQNIKQLIEEV